MSDECVPREDSPEEIASDNSDDIYKVAARVKNLARAGVGANLTAVGDGLCNEYIHVLMDFYKFAEKINNQELHDLIRKHEGMPARFITAVTPKKKEVK